MRVKYPHETMGAANAAQLKKEADALRSVQDRLDRFCTKHRNWAIPNLMLYIIIGNAAVYLLDRFSGMSLSPLLALIPSEVFRGQIWRLVTFVFVPESTDLLWLALSLYLYYFIGSALEREWGSAKFTIFYLFGVLMNAVAAVVMGFAISPYIMVTTQYLNLSLFLAFAALYPDLQFMLFFFIPVKAKWLAWFDAAIFAWGIVSSLFSLNWVGVILPIVSILNFFLFFSSDAARIFGRVKHRTSKQTINFKKATKEAQQNKGYLHKCAVCGRTDADVPGMEFRYCSKCNGYFCYCMDHINNHVHIDA